MHTHKHVKGSGETDHSDTGKGVTNHAHTHTHTHVKGSGETDTVIEREGEKQIKLTGAKE